MIYLKNCSGKLTSHNLKTGIKLFSLFQSMLTDDFVMNKFYLASRHALSSLSISTSKRWNNVILPDVWQTNPDGRWHKS